MNRKMKSHELTLEEQAVEARWVASMRAAGHAYIALSKGLIIGPVSSGPDDDFARPTYERFPIPRYYETTPEWYWFNTRMTVCLAGDRAVAALLKTRIDPGPSSGRYKAMRVIDALGLHSSAESVFAWTQKELDETFSSPEVRESVRDVAELLDDGVEATDGDLLHDMWFGTQCGASGPEGRKCELDRHRLGNHWCQSSRSKPDGDWWEGFSDDDMPIEEEPSAEYKRLLREVEPKLFDSECFDQSSLVIATLLARVDDPTLSKAKRNQARKAIADNLQKPRIEFFQR